MEFFHTMHCVQIVTLPRLECYYYCYYYYHYVYCYYYCFVQPCLTFLPPCNPLFAPLSKL